MDTPESWTEMLGATARYTSFGDSSPMRELLLTSEFTQRLDLVRHLAANSDRIPLVRGVHGVGKSTLMGLLLQQAPADWEIHRIDATPMLQPDQLIYGLCRHFSVQREHSEGIEPLVQRFTELGQTGRLPVVIVDDAEQLPVTTLRELFGIYSSSFGQTGGLALILFASPQIDDLLEETRLQFASQKLQVLELLPLNREQSDLLVRHLFKVLEGQQEMPLSDAGYEKIFRTSGGLPGKISQQVESILRPETTAPTMLAKKRTFRPQLLTDVSPPVLIGGGILALLLLLTLVYEDEINALFEAEGTASGDTGIETAGIRREIPLMLPDPPLKVERDESAKFDREESIAKPSGRTVESSENNAVPDLSFKPFSTEKRDSPIGVVVELPKLTTQELVNPAADPVITEQPPMEPMAPLSSAAIESDSPTLQAASIKTIKDQSERTEEPEEVRVAPEERTSSNSHPVQEAKKEEGNSLPAQVTELSRTKSSDKKNVPETVTLTRKIRKPAPVAVQEGGIRREAWLLQQAPGSFTLQLIGLGDEQAVTGFIQRHQLQGKAAYFRTKSNGRPWFPVLYGIYPSHSAAVAARSKLPEKLAAQGVWPRSLSSVQQAISGE